MKAVLCDCHSADAYLGKAFTGLPTEWFAQCQLGLSSANLAALAAGATIGAFNLGCENSSIGAGFDAFLLGDGSSGASFGPPADVWTQFTSDPVDAGAFSADTWHTVVLHFNAGTVTWLLDGSTIFTYAETFSDPADFEFGGEGANHITGEVYYIADVRIGTTLGGTDLFADDFSSGSFSAGWTGVHGAVSIVDDPFSSGDDFTISASPNPLATFTTATSHTSTVTLGIASGVAETVNFSVDTTGLPSGWTAGISPTSANSAGGTATLTVTAPALAPPGSYSVEVIGDDGTHTHTITPGVIVGSTAEGVVIAFTDPALGADPTFTRLDNMAGINVSAVNVKRGRPDERSKSAVGTGTVTGFDLVGATDPTNADGPFYGNLDPVKQAQILLYNPVAATWSPIFTGYTDDWTHVLDEGAGKLDFQLDLSDMLEMLNDAEIVPDQAGNTVPGESVGDVYYSGQHVDDRLRAVLADLGSDFPSGVFQPTWPAALLNIFTGNVNVQGRVYASRTTLLQVVDEACDAEFPGVSNRFVGKDGVFDFRGRKARYNADAYMAGSGNAGTARMPGSMPGLHWYVGDMAAYALDDTLAVYTALTFTRGKANLINAALVTPFGIAAADITGQFVYDPTSVGIYGPRTSGMSLDNLITGEDNDDGNGSLAETKAFGQGTVDNYKDPVTRVSQLVFRNPFDNNPATWLLLCGIELSDLITVTSTHPGGGGFSAVDFFVEGITYQIVPHHGDTWNVTLTLEVSPRAYYAISPFPS